MASSLAAKLAWMVISRISWTHHEWPNSVATLDAYFAGVGSTDDVVQVRTDTHARVKHLLGRIAGGEGSILRQDETLNEARLLLEELQKP